tara:strand:- start:1987 stop:2472 length:486 start_codon:yes stop_codon:yes gene_type:complete
MTSIQNTTTGGRASTVLGLAFLGALVIPALVFLLVGLIEGMSANELLGALRAQYVSGKQNLLVLGLVGCLPLALLALVVWILGRIKRISTSRRRFSMGGAFAILLVLLWVNFEYWPTFLPHRTYAGFPHGLEFVIGPFVFAPVAMVFGLLLAAFWPRRAAT